MPRTGARTFPNSIHPRNWSKCEKCNCLYVCVCVCVCTPAPTGWIYDDQPIRIHLPTYSFTLSRPYLSLSGLSLALYLHTARSTSLGRALCPFLAPLMQFISIRNIFTEDNSTCWEGYGVGGASQRASHFLLLFAAAAVVDDARRRPFDLHIHLLCATYSGLTAQTHTHSRHHTTQVLLIVVLLHFMVRALGTILPMCAPFFGVARMLGFCPKNAIQCAQLCTRRVQLDI